MSEADYLVGVEEYELAFVEDVLDDAPVDAQTVYKETINMSARAIAAEAAFRATSGGGGGGGTVDSVTAADGTITIGGTAADPTVAVDEIGTGNIANGAVTAAKVAADVATQAEVDAAIAALAALYQAKDTTLDTYASIDPSANVQSILSAADYAAIRTLLGLVIGTNVQAQDATLAALAAANWAANAVPVGTGADTLSQLSMGASTIFARLAAGDVVAATPAQIVALLGPTLPGYQLDRVSRTTNVVTTQTVRASADTVLTGGSVNYDGATEVRIEVYGIFGNSTTGQTNITLWEDSTDLTVLTAWKGCAAAVNIGPLYGRILLTPTAGAHVYTLKTYVVGASTGTIYAGTGTAGASLPPTVMRITTA